MPKTGDQIANLDAELDALSSPSTADTYAVTKDYDPDVVAASAAKRALSGGGGGGAAFSGARYVYDDAATHAGVTPNLAMVYYLNNTGPFYDTDGYGTFDGDGYVVGNGLVIPADGYYRVSVSATLEFPAGTEDSTWVRLVIVSQERDSDWDTLDHVGIDPSLGNGASSGLTVTHWFAQGDSVGVQGDADGTTKPKVRAALEVVFAGSGTNPAA